jgi:hypothetical protein
MTTAERIAACAYRHWMAAKMTEWPTVRQVCKRLRIRQSDIEECEGDGYYFTTGYNFHDEFCGDITVEADTPEVERAWEAYWFPYSHKYGAEVAS